jgi:hypothetical protein
MKIKNYIERSTVFPTNMFMYEYCDGATYVGDICVIYRKDGKFHNESVPARAWGDGTKEYWLNGKNFLDREEQWKIAIEKLKKTK